MLSTRLSVQPDFNAVVMEQFSLEDWSALYDYQKEKGTGKVMYNHPRLLEFLEYLKSHRRYMDVS